MKQITVILAILSLMTPMGALGQDDLDRSRPVVPELNIGRGGATRGGDALDKLEPELRALYDQFSTSRGGPPRGADETGIEGYTSAQLKDNFGIKDGETEPMVTVSVNFTSKADLEAITKAGGTVIARSDKVIYALIPVNKLSEVSALTSVSSVGVFKAMQIPSPVKDEPPPIIASLERGGAPKPAEPNALTAHRFNRQGMTGKGVIVGVIDSGIDWRHPDFIRPDGTSRILAIWDLSDNSYQTSKGVTGSKPPVYFEDSKTWLGTVYTNEQINAALKGTETVNSYDRFGHGTAVAGTAASSGRATANGVPAGTYDGVAPDADLMVVKAMDCNFFFPAATLTAEWITETAKLLKRPVVINMSFGSQFGPHDGSTENEQFIDSITGAGKPGQIITISAGNDGRYSLHAAGKFGPKRPGQADNFSDPVEVFVKEPTRIMAVFDSQDEWAFVFRGNNQIFQGADGKPTAIIIYKTGKKLAYRTGSALKNPEQFDAFFASAGAAFAKQNMPSDTVQIQMPVGTYILWGFGATANVKSGKFDLYVTDPAYQNKAFFGMGTEKNGMVGSPGNAKNAITVGSYDFRGSWETEKGETAFYNLTIGGPSGYTSPGFRRDGLVKPDISAPARYTISPLSSFSKPDLGGCSESMASGDANTVTRDGFHIAWEGTSASAPFTAGVIALMLEKNPTLDAEQVRQILKKTAKKDGAVGGVPNGLWGWGMLDPAAAVAATPSAAKGGKKPAKRK